jgi:hypothetical protein
MLADARRSATGGIDFGMGPNDDVQYIRNAKPVAPFRLTENALTGESPRSSPSLADNLVGDALGTERTVGAVRAA